MDLIKKSKQNIKYLQTYEDVTNDDIVKIVKIKTTWKILKRNAWEIWNGDEYRK